VIRPENEIPPKNIDFSVMICVMTVNLQQGSPLSHKRVSAFNREEEEERGTEDETKPYTRSFKSKERHQCVFILHTHKTNLLICPLSYSSSSVYVRCVVYDDDFYSDIDIYYIDDYIDDDYIYYDIDDYIDDDNDCQRCTM